MAYAPDYRIRKTVHKVDGFVIYYSRARLARQGETCTASANNGLSQMAKGHLCVRVGFPSRGPIECGCDSIIDL